MRPEFILHTNCGQVFSLKCCLCTQITLYESKKKSVFSALLTETKELLTDGKMIQMNADELAPNN